MKIAIVSYGFFKNTPIFDAPDFDVYECYWDIDDARSQIDRDDVVSPRTHTFDIWSCSLSKLSKNKIVPPEGSKICVYDDFVQSVKIPHKKWKVGKLASAYIQNKATCFIRKEAYSMIEDPYKYDVIIMKTCMSPNIVLFRKSHYYETNHTLDILAMIEHSTSPTDIIVTSIKDNGMLDPSIVYGSPNVISKFANVYETFETITDILWDIDDRPYCLSDIDMYNLLNNGIMCTSTQHCDVYEMNQQYDIFLHLYKSMFEYIQNRCFRIV